jgi:hypothetical protein
VLLIHSIRQALEDGLDEYRFLRGGEPFKYRFAANDPGLETYRRKRDPVALPSPAATRRVYCRLRHP